MIIKKQINAEITLTLDDVLGAVRGIRTLAELERACEALAFAFGETYDALKANRNSKPFFLTKNVASNALDNLLYALRMMQHFGNQPARPNVGLTTADD